MPTEFDRQVPCRQDGSAAPQLPHLLLLHQPAFKCRRLGRMGGGSSAAAAWSFSSSGAGWLALKSGYSMAAASPCKEGFMLVPEGNHNVDAWACRMPSTADAPAPPSIQVWDNQFARCLPRADRHHRWSGCSEASAAAPLEQRAAPAAAAAMAPPALHDQLDLCIPTIRDLEFLEQWCVGCGRGREGRPRSRPASAASRALWPAAVVLPCSVQHITMRRSLIPLAPPERPPSPPCLCPQAAILPALPPDHHPGWRSQPQGQRARG